MNLSVRQIRYLLEVAKQGSIQGASTALSISQSSILAAIGLAEAEIGTKLFDRRPSRGVTTTPTGERFLAAARALASAETEFDREVEALTRRAPSAIRIACFEPFGAMFMPEVLRRFVERVGPVEIELFEGDQVQLRDWLESGSVDLIVTYEIGPSFGSEITRICRIPLHAVLPADDPFDAPAISIAQLAERPLVLLDLRLTSNYLLTQFASLPRRPQVTFRTRSYETVRAAVASGFGASILNMRPLMRGLSTEPGLKRLPLTDDLAAPALIIADIYGRQKPSFVKGLTETMRRFFADLGPHRFAVTLPEREAGLMVP